MDKTNSLFPEKDIIDMRFMEFLKYGEIKIKTKSQVDGALQEYMTLTSKLKEIQKISSALIDKVHENANQSIVLIAGRIESIQRGIEEYYLNNWTDLSWDSGGDASKSEARLKFEHGEIIIHSESKTSFKIKPIKN